MISSNLNLSINARLKKQKKEDLKRRVMLLMCFMNKNKRGKISEKNDNSNTMAKSGRAVRPRFSTDLLELSAHNWSSPSFELATDDEDSMSLASSSAEDSIEPVTVKKSIRFNEKCFIKETTSRKEYSKREIDTCWYSAKECRGIQLACAKQIEKIEAGDALDCIGDTVRGLECSTRSASLYSKSIRMGALRAVLSEQKSGGSPERIAEKYYNQAVQCQTRAEFLGLNDQMEAESCYWQQ